MMHFLTITGARPAAAAVSAMDLAKLGPVGSASFLAFELVFRPPNEVPRY